MTLEIAYTDALAALAWQVELGADEAIFEEPINRYELPEAKPKAKPSENAKPPPVQVPTKPEIDGAAEAKAVAARANTLEELQEAITNFPHCELKRGARNTVFSDGLASAKVMVIGEAPGRDEDIQGKPFVGRAGQLLDKMLAAIDMDRNSDSKEQAVYITNILPWRPPQNRDPSPEEMSMMLPFVHRHIELADPQIVVLMGNIACHALLGRRGITRLRGNWGDVLGKPALPMFHPAYLLRNPHAKREAWADLLSLRAKLRVN